MDAHLVGRRRELEALTGWLAAARDGRGRLVLCAGEPGIGKTRLAQELAAQAAAQGVGRGVGPLRRGRGRARVLAVAAGAARARARRRARRAERSRPGVRDGGGESPEERFRLFDGVAEALRAAAHPALLVVLDDVHRADEPSLLVLRHLADRLADAPLLVLATFRDVEPADALRRALPELLRAGAVERLDLRRFGLDDVRAQLADPAQAQRVLDVTGGNPLFVREVARAIADGMWRPDRPPATVREVVAARLERVSEPCRTLVRAAAVVGRDFPLGLVAATLGGARRRVPSRRRRGRGVGSGRAAGPRLPVLPRAHPRRGGGLAHDRGTGGAAPPGRRGDRGAQRRRPRRTPPRPRPALGGARAVRRGRYGAAVGRCAAAEDAVGRLAYEEGCGSTAARWPSPTPRGLRRSAAARSSRWAGPRCCRGLPARGRGRAGGGPLRGHPASSRRRPRSSWKRCPTPRERAGHPALRSGAGRARRGSARLRAHLLAQRSHLAFYDGDQQRVEELSAAALARRVQRPTTPRWSAPCAPGRRRARGRPAGRSGCCSAPRWSRSPGAWAARAQRCGGGSGGSRR